MIFEHTYVFEFILCAETFYGTPFIIAVHRQQMVKLCRMHNICLFNLLANLPVCASYKEDRVKAGLGRFHLYLAKLAFLNQFYSRMASLVRLSL